MCTRSRRGVNSRCEGSRPLAYNQVMKCSQAVHNLLLRAPSRNTLCSQHQMSTQARDPLAHTKAKTVHDVEPQHECREARQQDHRVLWSAMQQPVSTTRWLVNQVRPPCRPGLCAAAQPARVPGCGRAHMPELGLPLPVPSAFTEHSNPALGNIRAHKFQTTTSLPCRPSVQDSGRAQGL